MLFPVALSDPNFCKISDLVVLLCMSVGMCIGRSSSKIELDLVVRYMWRQERMYLSGYFRWIMPPSPIPVQESDPILPFTRNDRPNWTLGHRCVTILDYEPNYSEYYLWFSFSDTYMVLVHSEGSFLLSSYRKLLPVVGKGYDTNPLQHDTKHKRFDTKKAGSEEETTTNT
jgi:hypothetical protein